MLKKLLTTLLSGSMLLSGIGLPVLANEQEPEIEEMESIIEEMDDEETEESSELIDSSYIAEKEELPSIAIRTPEEFQEISNNVKANYVLYADLDFSDFQWTKIEEFRGSLNGNGHKILNFTNKNGGLFKFNYGTIENLTLENAVVEVGDRDTDNAWEGGILTDSNYGIITRCTVKNSEIDIYNCVNQHSIGGIVGKNASLSNHKAIIEYCSVTGSKIVGANVGGIVGRNSFGSILYCQSQNNEIVGNGGNAESGSAENGASAGGIAGISNEGRIDYCYCDNLNFNHNKGKWCGYAFFGGIAGLATGDISNSYSKAESSYFGSYSNAGGYYSPAYGNLVGANSLDKIFSKLMFIRSSFYSLSPLNITHSYGDMNLTEYDRKIPPIDEDYSNLDNVSINPSSFSQKEIKALKDDILSKVKVGSIEPMKPGDSNEPMKPDDSNNGIISIPAQVKHYYGANTIEKSLDEEIKEAAKDFVSKMNTYLDTVETATSNVKQKSNSNTTYSLIDKGKKLRSQDENNKTHLITAVTNDSGAKDVAYSLLALYFDECIDKGTENKDIDFNKGNNEYKELIVSSNIFKKIINNIGSTTIPRKINGYTATLNIFYVEGSLFGGEGSFFGDVSVSKNGKVLINHATVCSDLTSTRLAFNNYLNTLSQWVKDALWTSFTSYCTDLGKITGVSDLTKKGIEKLFKNRLDALQKYGFGSLMTYFYQLQSGYGLVKKIVEATDNKLSSVLKNGQNIYDSLQDLNFAYTASESDIKSKLVQQAMNAVEKAKEKLTKKFKEYLDNKGSSSDSNKTGSFFDFLWKCPIDLSVLNEDGIEIISIKDGLINNTTEYLVEVENDAKHFRLPQDFKGDIQITPNGTGSMNCVIEKIENGVPIDRSFYQDLPVELNVSYTQNFDLKPEESSKDLKLVKNTISTNTKEHISPTIFFTAQEEKAVEITAKVIGKGQVEYDSSYSDNRYPIGQFISLLAIPDNESTQFVGWYQETPQGEVLLELSDTLNLLCTENRTVKAVFEKIKDEDNSSTPSLEPMDPKPSTPSDNNNSSTSSTSKPSAPVGGSGGSNSVTSTTKTNTMYRLYNPNSGEHFYTTDKTEKDHLVSVGWNYEGVGWKAPTTSNTPVYRLYNENAGDHHYTTDKNEKDTLVRIGWKDEKIGWYSDDQKGVPLYRVYNPNAQAGSHHYTIDKTEQDFLVGIGWNNEGIAWYGMK